MTNTLQRQDIRKHPIYSRFDEENIANLSNYWANELLWGRVYLFFHEQLKQLSPKELTRCKQKFIAIYATTENHFGDKFRSSGEPYFYHLLETAFGVMEKLYKSNNSSVTPDIFDIFLAILHDTIEDTHEDYDSLRKTYNDKKLAFWVHLISKKPFYTYIEDDNERRKYGDYLMEIWEDNIWLDEHIIDLKWIKAEIIRAYGEMRKKYRIERTKTHFSHYETFDTFFDHTKQETQDLKLDFSDTELKELCIRVIQVKLCDRLHNLQTLGHMDVKTIQRKVTETKKYLLPLAIEINPDIAEKIMTEITRLDQIIQEKTISEVKNDISAQLPKAS